MNAFRTLFTGFRPFLQGILTTKHALDPRKKKKIIPFFNCCALSYRWGIDSSIQKFQSKHLKSQKIPFGPFLQGLDPFYRFFLPFLQVFFYFFGRFSSSRSYKNKFLSILFSIFKTSKCSTFLKINLAGSIQLFVASPHSQQYYFEQFLKKGFEITMIKIQAMQFI